MIILSEYGGRPYTEVFPITLPITDGVTEVIFCPFCRDMLLQVDVDGASSGTIINTTVKGGLDGVGFDNLDVNDVVTTITEDGTTIIKSSGAALPFVIVCVEQIAGDPITPVIKAFFAVQS